MKSLGIDFKALATKAGGHAAGAALAGKLNSVSFINKIANPTTQGLVKALIGYVGIPLVAKKLKLSAGNKADLFQAVGEGVGVIGLLQAGNSKFPTIIPKVSGIDGYEENPIEGLGEMYMDDEVAGYETDPTLAGTEMESVEAGAV